MSAAPDVLIRTLVVEDEPLARLHLRELIAATTHLTLVGEAGDGREGLALLETLKPDVLFLDIHIPELDGLSLLEQATHQAQVVFTTAYDVHAVQAFELGAADYLLKPFGADRFARSIARLVERLHADSGEVARPTALSVSAAPPISRRLREVIGNPASPTGPLQHVYVRERGLVRPIPLREVERLEADDDYVTVFTRSARHLMTIALGELLERLDGARFVRVHRSHVVNLDWVASLQPHDAGRWVVVMRDGTRIVASRSGSRALREARERRPLPR
jgi:two-component system LytT family response regulator